MVRTGSKWLRGKESSRIQERTGEIWMIKLNLKELAEEVEMILAEGGLTFDQVDYLLYMETLIDEGTISEEDKRKIICRDF